MSVKINGVQVNYNGDSGNLSQPRWHRWNIDLASVGTNLQSVTSLTIGVQGSGAAGTLLLDDIGLYRSVPEAGEEVYLEAEAGTLGASWRTYTDPASSGGQYIGSEDGDGDDNADPPGAEWVATYNLTVSGGDYNLQARVITSPGNSFWFRIADAISPQITREDGWINAGIDNGNTWHWDENVVNFTLPAGQHTLEIAKREDGAMLDVVLITTDVE